MQVDRPSNKMNIEIDNDVPMDDDNIFGGEVNANDKDRAHLNDDDENGQEVRVGLGSILSSLRNKGELN